MYHRHHVDFLPHVWTHSLLPGKGIMIIMIRCILMIIVYCHVCFLMPMVASPLQMQGLYILTRGLGLENHVWFRSSCSTIFTTFTSQSLSRPLSIAINHHKHFPRCLNEARINLILHPQHPLHKRLDATPTWFDFLLKSNDCNVCP